MRFIFLIFIFYIVNNVNAQVGINTSNVSGIFHIDALGDNGTSPTSSQLSNDIVITKEGYVGVGTLPQARFHTKALSSEQGFILDDGSQESGRILTSDANGFGRWAQYTYGNEFAIYKLTHTGFGFTNAFKQFEASSASAMEYSASIDGAAATTQALILPKGKYLLFITGQIDTPAGSEAYFAVKLNGDYVGGPKQDFTEKIRAEFYLTQTDFYNFTDDVSLQIYVQLLDGSINFKPGYLPVVKPPVTLSATIKLIAMKLAL